MRLLTRCLVLGPESRLVAAGAYLTTLWLKGRTASAAMMGGLEFLYTAASAKCLATSAKCLAASAKCLAASAKCLAELKRFAYCTERRQPHNWYSCPHVSLIFAFPECTHTVLAHHISSCWSKSFLCESFSQLVQSFSNCFHGA
jgi:hypothetical protein